MIEVAGATASGDIAYADLGEGCAIEAEAGEAARGISSEPRVVP